MHYILGRIVVAFVVALISFIAYSSQIFIIWPWYGAEWSVELLTLLVPFNLLVGMVFWNYYLCVKTDPGMVPPSWRPDTHTDGYEVKKLTGEPRYCRVCKCYKPPRTHHCRDCNRCVLRMDHHCPWINNCVGHFNYSHFLRFLFYVDIACSYHAAMVTKRTIDAMKGGFWYEPSGSEIIFIILNYVTCIPVLLAVGGFSIYHFLNLLGNSTTIEGWEKDKVATMIRKGQIQEIKFPYDIGKMKNIRSVLGDKPLLWCWPRPMPGNGLKFELAYRDAENLIWPPRDPDTVNAPKRSPNASPFTYGDESLNPELVPSNIRNRRARPPANALPPYHPDYQEGQLANEDYDSEDDESESDEEGIPLPNGGGHFRRGSEGFEVRLESREEMLRRYIADLGEDPYRYNRYEPEPLSESELSEDDIPLGQTVTSGVESVAV